MKFSSQEYWSGLSFSSPGDLPNPGIEHGSPALQADSLPFESPGKPSYLLLCNQFSPVQSLSCVQLFATPWTACSTPGFPVHHQLPELAQARVHKVGDAIQPSHPLSSPSPIFNLSQHQGLFQ